MDTFEERKEMLIRAFVKMRNAMDRVIKDVDKSDTDGEMNVIIEEYKNIMNNMRSELQ